MNDSVTIGAQALEVDQLRPMTRLHVAHLNLSMMDLDARVGHGWRVRARRFEVAPLAEEPPVLPDELSFFGFS